jgi:hypothetical protein
MSLRWQLDRVLRSLRQRVVIELKESKTRSMVVHEGVARKPGHVTVDFLVSDCVKMNNDSLDMESHVCLCPPGRKPNLANHYVDVLA